MTNAKDARVVCRRVLLAIAIVSLVVTTGCSAPQPGPSSSQEINPSPKAQLETVSDMPVMEMEGVGYVVALRVNNSSNDAAIASVQYKVMSTADKWAQLAENGDPQFLTLTLYMVIDGQKARLGRMHINETVAERYANGSLGDVEYYNSVFATYKESSGPVTSEGGER